MNATFKMTVTLLKADIKRRLLLEEKPQTLFAVLSVMFKPGVISVILYRLSQFFYHHHLSVLCKVNALIGQLVNTSEISPLAEIGGGLVIADIGAVGIPATAVIGQNCTFMGLNTLTLGAMETAPSEDDQIVIGDHCVFGTFSRVIRPVKLANGTQIKPSSVVISSIKKEGQTLSGIPAKRKLKHEYEAIQCWNPLNGCALIGMAK